MMLKAAAILLMILLVLGLVSSMSLGGFIDLFLVLAVAVIIIQVIQGRKI